MHGGVGALVGGQQPHAAVIQRQRHAALRLQKGVLRPRGVKMTGQHIFGAADGLLGVTTGDVLIRLHIALVLLKDQRRIRRSGLLRVVDGREDLIRHLHQLLGLLQCLPVTGAHQSHGVAQIVGDLTDADHGGLILFQVAHIHLAGDVLLGQNAHHTGQCLRLAGIDGQHTGTGILAADGTAVAHPVHVHVVGVLAVAQYLLRHVQPVDPAAHLPVIGGGLRQLPLPEDLTRQQDAVDNLHISGAAADVVADGEGRLLTGGVGVYIQQRLGGDDHAGDAEAALHRAALGVGVDDAFALFRVADALDGQKLAAVDRADGDDAARDQLAVFDDGAGSALALAAAFLAAGEAVVLTQHVEQPSQRVALVELLLAVQCKTNLSVHVS